MYNISHGDGSSDKIPGGTMIRESMAVVRRNSSDATRTRNIRHTSLRRAGVVLLTLVALLAAACTNESSSGDGDSDTETSGGAQTAETPMGEPIKIMTMSSFSGIETAGPTVREEAVESHVEALNDAGGIGGRPVEVIACDGANDAVQEIACARQAIDEGVTAITGMLTADAADEFELFEAAGIPVIGSDTFATSINSPVSFPLDSGGTGQVGAMPAALKTEGATKVSAIIPDIAAAAAGDLETAFDSTAESNDLGNAGFVPTPLDTTDPTPAVATATSDGVDGVGLILVGDLFARVLQAMNQQHPEIPVVLNGGVVDQSVLDAAGDNAEGVLVTNNFPPITATEVDGISTMLEEYEAVGGDPSEIVGDTIKFWLATYVFGEVATQIADDGKTVDASTMLEALNEQTDIDTLGLTPTLDFTQPSDALPDATRLFNPTAVVTVVQDGEIVLVDPDDFFVEAFG